jgi:putative ABC transport system permease protein
MPEVKSVIAGLMDMIAFPDDGLFMVIANGWEPDCSVLQRVTMLKGRRLEAGDREKCMLGKILAANLHKKVGDKVELYSQPFEVIGIFESFSVYENGAVFMLMDELQKQMDRPGQATGFIVEANPRGDQRVIEKLRTKIESLDPSIAATPCEEFVRGINQMQVTRTMSWVTAAIAVFLGSIGVLNTMAMSVLERKTEIGALRAMGWRKSRVISLIVSESLILALGAAVSGVTLGLAITFALSKWKSTSVLIQGNWSISAILTGIILAGLMAILGAMYPAARVARTRPIDALRG